MSFKEVQGLRFDHNPAHPSFTIRWNEFDFGTTSKHTYKICSRCFPLKVKHFNFFADLIRQSFAGTDGLKELLELYRAELKVRTAKADCEGITKQIEKLKTMIGYVPTDINPYEMKEVKL